MASNLSIRDSCDSILLPQTRSKRAKTTASKTGAPKASVEPDSDQPDSQKVDSDKTPLAEEQPETSAPQWATEKHLAGLVLKHMNVECLC